MTREELINNIKYDLEINADVFLTDEDARMVIKALEEEPSEDAISRQWLMKCVNEGWIKFDTEKDENRFIHLVRDIAPPVNPQPKTGHWIMKHRTHNEIKHYTGQDEMGETHTISVLERYEADEPYCSECGKRAGDTSQNYCCACGAKLEGEE